MMRSTTCTFPFAADVAPWAYSYATSYATGCHQIRITVMVIGMAAMWGCNRGPAVQYVEGVVTLDGTPVDGAVVAFTPSGDGRAAAGTTDASGAYRLNSLTGREGAGTLVGDYLVTVRKWKREDPGPAPDENDHRAYAAWQQRVSRADAREPTYITPKAYGDVATSGLKASVKKGRNSGDAFRFDLKSDFKGP